MKEKLLGLIAGILYRIYSKTFCYELHFNSEESRKLILNDLAIFGPSKNSFLYAFFHQDELSFLRFMAKKDLVGLVSPSKDGQIMTAVMHYLGYQTTSGSSNKKPVQGFIQSLKKIKDGYKFGIAVDGPKGPIFEVKEGIIKLSEKSGKKIVGMRAYPVNYFLFHKSWNQAKLPKPFTKIILKFTEPDFYSKDKLECLMKSL
jgi:lysophospholipid acyltransferase (LPLAT)-like uncharacterized protein